MKKILHMTALLATSLLMVACDIDDDDDAMEQSAPVSVSQQSSVSSSSSVAPTNELDGVFIGQDGDETVTLTIADGKGTYETKDADGEIEVEQVVVDGENKLLLIGDDQDSYTLMGAELSIADEGEIISLKKQ